MYTKEDATMTRGLAVLCMVTLHLFFRERSVVLGTPLLWFNEEIPVVYWLGFYSEVCVYIYSICAGYAQYMLYKTGQITWRSTRKRILKLMINYWIILVMFSVAGVFYKAQNNIPGSWFDFIKAIVLLHSYSVAWWYLHPYILFLLLPSQIKYYPVEKLSVKKGIMFCLALEAVFYLVKKFGFWNIVPENYTVLVFVLGEIRSFCTILPSVWLGAILYKYGCLPKIHNMYYEKHQSKAAGKFMLALIWIVQFVVMNLLHKAVLDIVFALITFVLFNLWDKSQNTKKVFLYLGKHSTNIWLSHTFFYMTLFTGLVSYAKYPLFILGFTLALCLLVSYVELAVERLVYRILPI